MPKTYILRKVFLPPPHLGKCATFFTLENAHDIFWRAGYEIDVNNQIWRLIATVAVANVRRYFKI